MGALRQRRLRSGKLWLAFACLGVGLVPAASRAAELDYRGAVLSGREMRALAADALQAPADSARRARLLGLTVARLQGLGYLEARASATLDTVGSGAPRLVVRTTEGVLHRFARVRIDAPGFADSVTLAAAALPARGTPASPAAIERAVRRVLAAADAVGFAYARLGVTRWDVERDSVRVTLNGVLGPRVVVTGARIDGLVATRRSLAERAMGPLADRLYDPLVAETARQRLEQLGLFSRVEYLGLRGERDWRFGQLHYAVEEPRYNRFDGVAGVQGEAGTVGRAALELGNLLGTGRQVGLGWQSRGRGLVDLSARYVEPLVAGLPLAVRAGVEQQVQDTLYVRTRWGARAIYAITALEKIEAGYELERAVQEAGEVEEAETQYTVFGLERTALDRRAAPRRGTRARIEGAGIFKRERLRPAATRTSTAGAVALEGEWHRPLGARGGLTLEWNAAGRFSSQRVLAAFERYPVGGAASLRGFDEEAFRVDRYAVTRLEWRWFFGDGAPRAFAFWDHAWMATREPALPSGERLDVRHADGFGAGLRIEAAGGIVGVDYGLEAGRAPLDGKIHLRLVSNF
jgi:outer membrane protein assembly factor BamA